MWIERIPCLKIDKEKREVSFDLSSERQNELVEFYDRCLSGDLDYFAISPELNPALYKLSEMFKEKPWPELKLIHFGIPGLYSLGIALKDEKGTPAIYNDTARDVMVKMLAAKAKWLEQEIKRLFLNVQTMFTVGNGGLAVYSSAGGTGTWDDIKRDYNEIMGAVEGITCIHCCANFDWSLLMETNADVINFDAYQYGNTMSLYSHKLKEFLGRGGMIAWGIVPTAGAGNVEDENPGSLMERLERSIQSVVDRGIDEEMLLESSWITPTCDTTTMPIELADRVYDFTREVSQRMREKYFG
jgi:hypothetical protein